MRLRARIREAGRRGLATVVATVLLGGAATYAAADELGILPSATTESPTPSRPTASASSEPAPSAEASPSTALAPDDAVTYSENAGGGGGRNIVNLRNETDGQLAIRGSIQLNRIKSPTVAPVNLARAYSSCVGCRSLAVAMQINLIERGAPRVAPENAAVALNVTCRRCLTIAIALQYTVSVDDPLDTPADVRALIRDMDAELRAISTERDIDLREAALRIDAVIARFRALAESLDDRRDVAEDDASPDASAAPSQPAGSASPGATEPAGSSPAGSSAPEPTPTTSESPVPSSASPVPLSSESVAP